MNKKITVLLVLFIFCVGGLAFISFGDDTDPLISKSYFDKKIQEIKNEFDEKLKNISKNSASDDTENKADENDNSNNKDVNVSDKFTPVQFFEGDKVIFSEGTEFILRSGEARVIDDTGNGMPDLTDGNNLHSEDLLPKNHLILSPRDDGRGIKTTSISIWLMVKGDYKVIKAENSDE